MTSGTNIYKSAGLALIKDNKLLLGHPANSKRQNFYSIPKGQIHEGESKIDAAIRETKEEIGIDIPISMINTEPEYKIEYKNKKGEHYKTVYYYIVYLPNNFISDIISIEQLQPEEIDYAEFLTHKEAESKIFWRFKPILKHIENEI